MKKKKLPVKILTLDTETYDGLKGSLKRIAVYDGQKVTYGYKFKDVEPVLKDYYNRGFEVHVYVHNMEFDLRKIPSLFYDNNVIWEKSFVIAKKIAKLSCRYYTFHDSLKILPSSLSSLSKSFDVECGKLDLLSEIEKRYPNKYDTTSVVDFLDRCDVDDELFLEYLGYDVISLYQVIEKARKRFGLSEKDWVRILSTASLSRFIFKNGWKGKPFQTAGEKKTDYEILTSFQWHQNKESDTELTPLDVENIIRESYCGGRTEVFKPILDHDGFHYDVNSLYPSQFHQQYPVGKYEFLDDAELIEEAWNEWLKRKRGLGFITADVFIPEQHIPPLPVQKGKLMFPTGYVSGTWTYIELEYAVKHCGVEILQFHEMIHFKKTFTVFSNFVNTFYPMKEESAKKGDSAGKMVAKLLLNVAYGYTGMRRDDKYSLVDINDLYDEKGIKEEYLGKVRSVNEEFGYAEIETDVSAEYIQVQVASYVTSYARLVLLDALRKANEEANVYYCDTDSIVTDAPLPDEIVDSTKLGYWDLESKPEKAVFLRPKLYAEYSHYTDKKTGEIKECITKKFKGISRETIESWAYDKYELLLEELARVTDGTQTEESILLETDKLVLPSIMVMLKNNRDLSEYDFRNKKINLLNKEKRQIDYRKNFTKPWYMESLEAFEQFDFLHAEETIIV